MASSRQITGGCLCGQVRYKIDFSADYPWPPAAHTCQCTQCRKNTGALIAHLFSFPSNLLTWSHNPPPQSLAIPPPPFKEYSSSATCYRGFCSNCGGSLTWRTDDRPDEVEIFTGSVDEEYLIGARTKSVASSAISQRGGWEGCLAAERMAEKEEEEEEEQEEEDGGWSGKVTNGGGLANGRELAVPKKHFFYRNAVGGATDRVHALTDEVGERWVEDTFQGWKIS